MPTPKLNDPGEQLVTLEELRTFLLAASLPSRSTLEALGDAFLDRLRRILEYEIGSVYLKTTRGSLDRITTVVNAQSPSHWAASYIDGANTLGALLEANVDLPNKQDAKTLEIVLSYYRDLIGEPFTVERVALQGSSQVFGMVELACRRGELPMDTGRGLSGLHCLSIASSYLAGAITTFRSRNETMVLAALSRFLSDPGLESESESVKEIFGKALKLIVDGLLDYRAAILRVATSEGVLEVYAREGDPAIIWDGWVDHVVRGGEALSGEVLMQKDRVIAVHDIAAHRERFVNFDWTVTNQLRSCVSCPLVARGRTVGTVTFYTGFYYHFSELDEASLWCFAARFAAYWDRFQVLTEKEKTEAELEDIRFVHHNRLLDSARQAAVRASESQLTGLLHESKGTYTSAILLLVEARDAAPAERLRLLDRCLTILQAGEQRLDGPRLLDDFESDHTVDVNEQIRNLVQQRKEWRKERRIGVRFDLTLQPIPLMSMSEEDVIEMVENLLSNAIRSIRTAGRKRGEIQIATSVAKTGDVDEMELVVQDNGTGVRRDIQEDIFEKGFTTYGLRGGTGLGLYLVRSIVTGYRGRIRVESQYGAWARFIIRIPIVR